MNNIIKKEEEFWDNKAGNKIKYYRDLINTPDEKIYKLTFFMLSLLGGVGDKNILDLGCGYGGNSCFLAKKGAKVSAIDISSKNIEQAKKWCAKNSVTVDVKKMQCEKLDFPDNYFDFVVGSFVLHHVDIEKTSKEIGRVLKKGGKAVFVETFSTSGLLMFFRDKILKLLGSRKNSPGEYPLTVEKIKKSEAYLGRPVVYTKEMVFFRLAASYFFKDNHFARKYFSAIDDFFYKYIPKSRNLSYYKIIEFSK